jgi:hypothetical protein
VRFRLPTEHHNKVRRRRLLEDEPGSGDAPQTTVHAEVQGVASRRPEQRLRSASGRRLPGFETGQTASPKTVQAVVTNRRERETRSIRRDGRCLTFAGRLEDRAPKTNWRP